MASKNVYVFVKESGVNLLQAISKTLVVNYLTVAQHCSASRSSAGCARPVLQDHISSHDHKTVI